MSNEGRKYGIENAIDDFVLSGWVVPALLVFALVFWIAILHWILS